jgi:hypothetical protein
MAKVPGAAGKTGPPSRSKVPDISHSILRRSRHQNVNAPAAAFDAAGHELVIDGEIAAPNDRGVTHLDFLNDTIARREPHRLAYFAFDLLHIDGHDLRRCPLVSCGCTTVTGVGGRILLIITFHYRIFARNQHSL